MISSNHPFVENCQWRIAIGKQGIELVQRHPLCVLRGKTREQTIKSFEASIAVWRDALQELRTRQLAP
jgi:hypothetical protein